MKKREGEKISNRNGERKGNKEIRENRSVKKK